MKHVLGVLLAVAGLAAATPIRAAETVYDCTASFNTTRGFIAPRIVFFVDAQRGTVRVLDGIIQAVNGGPVEGSLKARSEKVHRIDWRVSNVATEAGALNITYRANLNHAAQTYTMEARIGGYDNDARGQGSCKVAR
ncbi:hypothetical protein [Roseobacter sinensis]|uniref:Excinuclease ABC subunit A n=1 Tax=Roseobacter sinensis TaxID=2931391 RepID=A0ABT3BG79_9RHOB|nr:hypothetical protein [Roseobacter sp. WL0113]MCV3272584.1 hypothetical protein [Roseobacter sp. WL0113]